jgi:hypothetical protein
MADQPQDEASRLLEQFLSPAEAQSLVLPPPTHAPSSGPGESTPLSGTLAREPSQAVPSRQTEPTGQGLASRFAGAIPDRSADPTYIKVYSKGQTGYLPRANLRAAREIDRNLQVLSEGQP